MQIDDRRNIGIPARVQDGWAQKGKKIMDMNDIRRKLYDLF